MSWDLSWSNHMDVIANRANKVLGLKKHTVGNKNKEFFPSLTSPVWSPHLVKDILAI